MTTKYTLILTCIFLLITLKVIGQADSSNYSNREINKIDSLIKIIDDRNPKIENCDLFIDSLAGEKVISITKQVYNGIGMYNIKTNRTGTQMDVKLAELYLYQDTLIQAAVFYSDNKQDFYKKLYFKDNINFYTVFSHGVRISLDDTGEEFIELVKKIVATVQPK
ncbi:hypothetical protein SDC9_65159 [bioreactor metagenome]|uniref:Uncharacterized protein n=1 Tax=bioreactor metagenome TaxID=1076179 RepID=A0A644XXG3_9ZZZZ